MNLMVQYIRDTFGMTIEELYSLPTGEWGLKGDNETCQVRWR
jgi:hypothetical protein